jgi:hypothetical protein
VHAALLYSLLFCPQAHVLKKANKIYLKADIDGGMKFERQMNLISDAGKLRCNKIIDDEKGHYNGLELD